MRESAHLWAIGERARAVVHLETALVSNPSSVEVVSQLIEYKAAMGDLPGAEGVFRRAVDEFHMLDRRPFTAMAKAYLDAQNLPQAIKILSDLPAPVNVNETIDQAILYKRAERWEMAHRIFTENFDLIRDDPRAIHEFAQVKMDLARKTKKNPDSRWRLDREAAELLHRAIQLSDDPRRLAWCWANLATVLIWLAAPETEIKQAYENALALMPYEERFQTWYRQWQHKKTKNI